MAAPADTVPWWDTVGGTEPGLQAPWHTCLAFTVGAALLCTSTGVVMIGSWISAMALATSPAAAAAAPEIAAQARDACGLADAAVIDAGTIETVADLAARIELAGGASVIVTGAVLDGQDMRRAGRLLAKGCLFDSSIKDSDWSGVIAPDVRIVRTDLDGADFTGAALVRSRFEGVGLAKARFTHANLAKARFVGASGKLFLGEARFDHARMEGAVFECGITVEGWCMDATEARFFGARFAGSDLTALPIWSQETMRGAMLGRDTAVHPRTVRYLTHASVPDTLVLRAGLSEADDGGDRLAEAPITAPEFRALNDATRAFAADRPSFDCTKAASHAEQLVCGEYASSLRAADRDLAALYAQARASGHVTAASQRAWLAQRDRCPDAECLEAAYRARIDALFAAQGNRFTLGPGAAKTFRQDVLPLPSAMRGSELYRRILPVLADASWQDITLTGNADGSIAAEGFALGSNAHMCELSAPRLMFDPRTGWFSTASESGAMIPLLRVWGERLIMRYSGNMGDTPDQAQAFVSCGARAFFTDLRDLGE